MQKVKLSNGYVMVKPFVDRKTMRLYRKALFSNSHTNLAVGADGVPSEKLSLDAGSMDEANDVLVRQMVVEANIDAQSVPLDDNFFDSMKQTDFDKILLYATKLISAKDEEKKS